jgi:hypothetical protein
MAGVFLFRGDCHETVSWHHSFGWRAITVIARLSFMLCDQLWRAGAILAVINGGFETIPRSSDALRFFGPLSLETDSWQHAGGRTGFVRMKRILLRRIRKVRFFKNSISLTDSVPVKAEDDAIPRPSAVFRSSTKQAEPDASSCSIHSAHHLRSESDHDPIGSPPRENGESSTSSKSRRVNSTEFHISLKKPLTVFETVR